jgi:hypothetical protein
MPKPRPIRTWQDAEENAAEWMRYWGFSDAQVTVGGPDAGVDITSSRAIAQVKARVGNVSRPDLQRLLGARGLDHHKQTIFFTMADYTLEARRYADTVSMALFRYGINGEVQPVNGTAVSVNQIGGASEAQSQNAGQAGGADWWRLGLAAVLFFIPFMWLGSEDALANDSAVLNVLEWVAGATVLWGLAAGLVYWHIRSQRKRRRHLH